MVGGWVVGYCEHAAGMDKSQLQELSLHRGVCFNLPAYALH